MDTLVTDRVSRHRHHDHADDRTRDDIENRSHDSAQPDRVRVLGLLGAAVVLGVLFLGGAFERGDRTQLASGEPPIVYRAPAIMLPESPVLP